MDGQQRSAQAIAKRGGWEVSSCSKLKRKASSCLLAGNLNPGEATVTNRVHFTIDFLTLTLIL